MHSNNGHNGGGDGPDHSGGSGNDESAKIIRMPSARERAKAERVRVKVTLGHPGAHGKAVEPLINLPPFTKNFLLLLLGIHLASSVLINDEMRYWLFSHFGFTPAFYTGTIPFSWPALAGPFTYAFLHGGLTHLLMNSVMLVAFGAGLERWMGWKRMAAFMLACSLISALVQLMFEPGSDHPVIGASGAISGMFAAAIVMLKEQGRMPLDGRYGMLPFILVWIGVSVLFGMMGGPGGETIAWPAHIGGFLAGLALIRPVLRLKV